MTINVPTRRDVLVGGPTALVGTSAWAEPKAASFAFWHEDTILLPIKVRGRPYTGLLDTGVAGVVLDTATAKALGLRASGELALSTATRSFEAPTLGPETIEVSGEKLNVGRLVLEDLTSIAAAMGHAVEIVLGEDLFLRFAVHLDFTRQLLNLAPAGFATGPGTRASLERGPQGRRITWLRLEGHEPVPAVFDLGSSMPLMISRRYARTIGLLDRRKVSTAAVAQLSGVEVSTALSVRELGFAGHALTDVPAEVFEAWRLEDVPVVLGLPALAQFRLTIDYSAGDVFIASDPGAGRRPMLRDMSGLGFAVLEDRLQIVHVAQGGPAQGAWRIGEEIVAINGRRVDRGYGQTLWRWRSGGLGPRVHLTLATGAARTLELVRYY